MADHVHILIVEDSKTQATEIKLFLEKSDYKVSVCYDGEEAWAFMQNEKVPPALVISDIVMPKMNGYELCEKIREHEKFSDVMVMLLTALSEPTDIIKGLKSQADSFLIKPYNKRFLLGRIGHLLEFRNFIKEMPGDMGLAIDFFGQRHFLTHKRVEIINNLLSVHDTVEIQSNELKRALDAEKKLKESEERYRLLADNVTDNLWIFDLDTMQFSYVSPSVIHITGYTAEEATGFQLEDILTPSSLDFAIITLNEELAESEKNPDPARSRILEFEQYRKDGSIVWTEASMRFIYDHEGRPAKLLGITRDITERKEYEDALRKSEERYRSFVQNFKGIAFKAELSSWTPTFFHGAVEEISGYTEKDFINGTPRWDQVIHPEDIKNLAGKKEFQFMPHFSIERDYRIIRKDGKIRWVHELSRNICDESGKPVEIEGTIIDITLRKQAEEEKARLEAKYRQAQKMESLGLLAGGVAHDLNNVLSGIVSYPELILTNLPAGSKLRKPLETMMESGHRAVDIVQEMLTIARGVATAKEPLNLNHQVKDYLNSPEFKKLRQFHPAVTIKTDLDANLLNIAGSPVHIRKVAMNLILNASEAIQGNGNVTVSTENRHVDSPLKGYDEVSIGEYAVLTVSDDGPGISSGDLERIFEPFYTKKVMGRSGTGLGLAVVWNVMHDHKGYIDVLTSENGTSFKLYFPVTRDKNWKKEIPLSVDDYKGSGETVLIVDDEENQREISCKLLEMLGYKSEVVSSGEEAVEYLKKHTVDLLLLDMIMAPGISGLETYKRIIKIHPNQKAIIISGFSETDDVKEAQKLGAGRYIKKPLTLISIGLAVQEELRR